MRRAALKHLLLVLRRDKERLAELVLEGGSEVDPAVSRLLKGLLELSTGKISLRREVYRFVFSHTQSFLCRGALFRRNSFFFLSCAVILFFPQQNLSFFSSNSTVSLSSLVGLFCFFVRPRSVSENYSARGALYTFTALCRKSDRAVFCIGLD